MARRKMKLTWWVLTKEPPSPVGSFPPRHAFREGRERAMCGGERDHVDDDGYLIAYELRGPKTIAKHPMCQRCASQLARIDPSLVA